MTAVPPPNSPSSGRRRFDWRLRHLAILVVAGLATYGFLESRAQWSEMHRWNRAFGDASALLIALAMAAGPLARLRTEFRPLIPWRRELGIYGVLLAAVHTAIVLAGWIEWDMIRLFGYEFHPQAQVYVMFQHGFGLANVIGIVALLYGAVLALTSNDLSQRVLSGTTWKFLQQGAYVLWILVVIHTAYFMYLHFQSFHRPVPNPNWAQIPFAALVGTVLLLQLAAFAKTWTVRRTAARPGEPEAASA